MCAPLNADYELINKLIPDSTRIFSYFFSKREFLHSMDFDSSIDRKLFQEQSRGSNPHEQCEALYVETFGGNKGTIKV